MKMTMPSIHALRNLCPTEADLHRAMGIYTAWLDEKLANVSESVSKAIKKG
jgi:hypothetical protein